MNEAELKAKASQVVAGALMMTNFPVSPEKIDTEYEPEMGVTRVLVESFDILSDRNAHLALRQAIGQSLAEAYSEQLSVFNDESAPEGITIGRGIDMGPPQKTADGSPVSVYPYRDLKEHVDLTPYIGLIDPNRIRKLFLSHYLSGPNPDGRPTFTAFD